MGLENLLSRVGVFNRKLAASSLLGLSLIACSGSGEKGQPTAPSNSGPTGPTTTTPKQNIPPTILSTPPTQVNENSYYEYQIQARGNNGILLNYGLTEGPAWLDVISNSISGKAPEVYQNTTIPIKIKVSDGVSSSEQGYNLNIVDIANTRVLTTTQVNQLTNVSANTMSFSQPVTFVAKDIIGTGISTKTPEGTLREVISVSPDKKTVYTAPATLEQAVSKASLSFSKNLSPSNVQSYSLKEGVSVNPANLSGFNFSFNLENVVLYDRDGNNNTKGDQLVANGNVSFNTSFLFNIDINNFVLNNLEFKNISTEKIDVSIGSNLLGIAAYKEVKIIEYRLQPFVIGYLPTPIPLPIVITPKIGIYMGMNPTFINPLALRVTQEANLETRIAYSGGWTGSANFSNSFDFSNSLIDGDWELNVFTGPKLDVSVYGVAGATATVNGKLRLDSKASDWKLYGGLNASIGLFAEVFSKRISSNVIKVIEYEKFLSQRGGIPSTPTEATGSFTDTRDGTTYKTIKVGNQIWMAQNLKYNHSNSKNYNNLSSNGEIYGRLYGRVGANASCPSGWKLPNQDEWEILFNSLGGREVSGTGGKMKSTGTIEAGNGLWHSPNKGANNQSGFAAVPGGMGELSGSTPYSHIGRRSYHWVATPNGGAFAYILSYDTESAGSAVAYGTNIHDIPLFSVRCLKN